MIYYTYVLTFFTFFLKIQKTRLFTFFELLRTFSGTLMVTAGVLKRLFLVRAEAFATPASRPAVGRRDRNGKLPFIVETCCSAILAGSYPPYVCTTKQLTTVADFIRLKF